MTAVEHKPPRSILGGNEQSPVVDSSRPKVAAAQPTPKAKPKRSRTKKG
jgi:hypothetical protein